ncbi:DUF1643 domain-containing protein [Neptunomonas qingdaonensis]|uniref:DUF1643 domain-containing protein n=1 Tax=Neptunomonas qingdaonensis TaxID=1045558 RepID=A0A1I2RI34_9GAMM|nr:DUF1643 domain-containing protein [Neptunomonas qingdaonensis]SFG37436.1 Protein of unknown function [Neptunomonas qingdaonensis]
MANPAVSLALGGEMDCYVKGYFYLLTSELTSVKARTVLTISKEKIEDDTNLSYDLLVVMMNPGCSTPKSPANWNDKPIHNMGDLSEAVPDDTQFQIMKVMNKTGYKNAIILNLSDVCETDSKIFAKSVSGIEYSGVVNHSIFSDARSEELSMILSHFKGNTVILASGVNFKLRYLTRQMLSKLKYPNLISKPHENGQFYHPLPRGGKEAWVKYIVDRLEI